jgi:hypothetical protein
MPENLRPENPSKQLQIPPENPAPSNSRNGRKIPAVNYRYGRKIPASKNRYGRKILRPVTKKRPESLIINATETSAQGCSGAVEEYLVCNLKVGGSRPACAQVFFQNAAGKFRWR